jgi:signal transduction histidine kinase
MPNIETTITSLIYLFVGINLAFALNILLFAPKIFNTIIWVISNFVGIFGILLINYSPNDNLISQNLGISVLIFSGILKSFAFSSKNILQKRYLMGNIIVIFGVIFAIIILLDSFFYFRRLYFYAGLLCAILASFVFLFENRLWRGLKQRNIALSIYVLSTIGILIVIFRSIPFDPADQLINTTLTNVTNFVALNIASVSVQLAFTSLIRGHVNRKAWVQSRVKTRLQERTVLQEKILFETAALSNERENFIKMLTHEIRQPLNTAQAALQSISQYILKIEKNTSVHRKLKHTISVLNSITLSISNSIIGASLISNHRKSEFQVINVSDVAQIAFLDINPADQPRFSLTLEQEYIHAEADPIILRLAIRNLVENALKYSPKETPITLEVCTNETDLSVLFKVKNFFIDKEMLSGDIFLRNTRIADKRYGGEGLGLFIASEVAKIHNGSMTYKIVNKEVIFTLQIPA